MKTFIEKFPIFLHKKYNGHVKSRYIAGDSGYNFGEYPQQQDNVEASGDQGRPWCKIVGPLLGIVSIKSQPSTLGQTA